MDDRPDNELVAAYLSGEGEALENLIKRHIDHVYNFLYRFGSEAAEASDMTQETFLKVWKNLKKFDQSKNFRTWLFTIARNSALDHIKKKKALPFSAVEEEPGDLLNQFADPEPLAQELFDRREMREAVTKAIENLPAIYQSVLLLRYEEDLTFQEIAEVLGEPLNTVKSRYGRALRLLKESLEKP